MRQPPLYPSGPPQPLITQQTYGPSHPLLPTAYVVCGNLMFSICMFTWDCPRVMGDMRQPPPLITQAATRPTCSNVFTWEPPSLPPPPPPRSVVKRAVSLRLKDLVRVWHCLKEFFMTYLTHCHLFCYLRCLKKLSGVVEWRKVANKDQYISFKSIGTLDYETKTA